MTVDQDEPLKAIRPIASEQAKVVPRENLRRLQPGVSTLEAVYTHAGHPSAVRELPGGFALRYPSEAPNLPHIVLIERPSTLVQLVALYNHDEGLSLAELERRYGPAEPADTIRSREHHFFVGAGVAAVAESRNDDALLFIQYLPANVAMTMYQEAGSYARETCAFTPGEFEGLEGDPAADGAQTAVCPVCGALAVRGCLYGADRNRLRWFEGKPSALDNIASFFGGGEPVGDWGILVGPYAEGTRCATGGKIVLDG